MIKLQPRLRSVTNSNSAVWTITSVKGNVQAHRDRYKQTTIGVSINKSTLLIDRIAWTESKIISLFCLFPCTCLNSPDVCVCVCASERKRLGKQKGRTKCVRLLFWKHLKFSTTRLLKMLLVNRNLDYRSKATIEHDVKIVRSERFCNMKIGCQNEYTSKHKHTFTDRNVLVLQRFPDMVPKRQTNVGT